MKFLLSRIMQIIGKLEINKYLKFTLSKVTYEKYLIQWKIITSILTPKRDPCHSHFFDDGSLTLTFYKQIFSLFSAEGTKEVSNANF